MNNLNSELNKIRMYLVKIGPSRRQGDVVLRKIKEADNIVSLFNTDLEKIEQLRASGKGRRMFRNRKSGNILF